MQLRIISNVINRTSSPFSCGGRIEGAVVEAGVESLVFSRKYKMWLQLLAKCYIHYTRQVKHTSKSTDRMQCLMLSLRSLSGHRASMLYESMLLVMVVLL